MRFNVTQNDFQQALRWATRPIPNRPSQPILSGVKITAANGTVSLAACDYEQSSSAVIETADEEVFEEGVAVVSGYLLRDIARALPSGTVSVSLEGSAVIVKIGSVRFSLPTMPSTDYPDVLIQPPKFGSVNAANLADAVKAVTFAADKSGMFPVLGSVLITTDPDKETLTMVCTNRFHLAAKTIGYAPEPGAAPVRACIPASVVEKWMSTFKFSDEETFSLTSGEEDGLFGINSPTLSAATRVTAGEFPQWQKLFPDSYAAESGVSTTDFVGSVKRVGMGSVTSRDRVVVFFNADEETIELTIRDEDDAPVASETQTMTGWSGDESIEVVFNDKYFTEGLSRVAAANATVKMNGPTKPVVVESEEDTTYRYLIMPARRH